MRRDSDTGRCATGTASGRACQCHWHQDLDRVDSEVGGNLNGFYLQVPVLVRGLCMKIQ